ncbi:hypothetical protein P0W64_15685 [Tsukamurella sp. 8F]|uniref:hypothetical protein n=1 Tax=unclassified Tsukamurella TaxID=2633480 RepID=UPI0023B92D42|nr:MULTISPECIES: hypothetical protein [unclassified Tsukamurella]MDF0530834.1 hypothetical protein [Tsukamurella sp. 8J]MDF0588221.1 hypothetical protein [Tsukamurella sp. 8F]
MSEPVSVEEIKRAARERVQARLEMQGGEDMVLDGDPIEEIAAAHERHAMRVRATARTLKDVARFNYLGDTSEGRTATRNVRLSAVDHPESLYNAMMANADAAVRIAAHLREDKAELLGQEHQAQYEITNTRTAR